MMFTGILIGLILAIALAWIWKVYSLGERVGKFIKNSIQKLIGDRPDDRK